MSERRKALIINCCYTSNFGDQAIGVTMKSIFEQKGCLVDLFDLIRVDGEIDAEQFYNEKLANKINPEYDPKPTFKQVLYSRLTKCLNAPKWKQKNVPKIDRICKNGYDVVLIGGGELVQSNGIFPVAIGAWIKAVKQFSPKAKIVFFGVGVTGSYTVVDKRRMAKAIVCADAFFVRDRSSVENLKKVFGRSAELISDVVLGGYEKQQTVEGEGKTVLYGITAFSRLKRYHYKNFESRRDYYEDCYREMLDAGYLDSIETLKLFYSDTQDYCECHAFAKYVQKYYQKKVAVCSFKNLEGFEKEIADSRVVISPRMHACIFGLIYNREVKPVCISPKTQAFYDEYVCVPHRIDEFYKALLNAADKAIDEEGIRS